MTTYKVTFVNKGKADSAYTEAVNAFQAELNIIARFPNAALINVLERVKA